jgi:leader peptidase (prepilin peptidase)/N-methyltransferase
VTMLAAVVVALFCLAAAPYSARLTRTVPDRADRRWYVGARPTRSTLTTTSTVALVLGLLAGAAARWSAVLPAYAILAAIATVLVVVDIEHHRLPNRLLYPAAAATVVLLAVAAAVRNDWSAYIRAVEAAGLVYVVFFALALISPKALGMGDVRLAALLAAYLGFRSWPLVYVGLLAGFAVAAAGAIVLLISRRATRTTPLPFGPALILGSLLVLMAIHPGR